MNLELIDKTALVSGSTKGIGFAIASQLAAEGANVIVNGRSDNAVNSASEQIRKTVPEAKVKGFAGDLATSTTTEALLERFPAMDILVNNLGISEPKPFETISDEDWRHVFEVNVLSGVRLSRAYVSGMKQRNWGRIVLDNKGIQTRSAQGSSLQKKRSRCPGLSTWPDPSLVCLRPEYRIRSWFRRCRCNWQSRPTYRCLALLSYRCR
jgi:NAD(P)-dependent dehydrogenase (short-subunit alcohol dehydrogenase family)